MAIKFRILGFPITMSWVFPAFLLFLGYISDLSGTELAVWVVFGTFAILVHELGHAVAFRHYGLESSIAFWGLGGVTNPNDQEAIRETAPDNQNCPTAFRSWRDEANSRRRYRITPTADVGGTSDT